MQLSWKLRQEQGFGSSVTSFGKRIRLGERKRTAKFLYTSIGGSGSDPSCSTETRSWDPRKNSSDTVCGGIFGMDFSPDGSMLVAGCEQKSLLIFDPLRAKFIRAIERAHDDCVNSVKFLDNRILASCSDDHSVKLWDLRCWKSPMKTLRAHRNWVKNIEFVSTKGLLLSSAFDGNIYAWDINDPHMEPRRMFYTPGLMRMRLTPDNEKMILSTQWGYLLAVHNLDFETLPADLFGFKPNMFWLMVKSGNTFRTHQEHIDRFCGNRNRTELIMDFPDGCDPENISSIAPHPQSWCFASRSSNHDEQSEWTCVHDLQLPAPEACRVNEEESSDATSVLIDGSPRRGVRVNVRNSEAGEDTTILVRAPATSGDIHRRRRGAENIITLQMNSDVPSDDEELEHLGLARAQLQDGSEDEEREEDSVDASTSQQEGTVRRHRREHRGVRVNVQNSQVNARISISVDNLRRDPRAFFVRTGPVNTGSRTIFVLGSMSRDEGSAASEQGRDKLVPTFPRLGYYRVEPRMGRGYIKEQSWSSDGRVLASPFGFGVRILGFSPDCADLAEVSPLLTQPAARPLSEVSTILKSHSSVVLCTKFSPTHCLLASGCLKGRVAFSQPVL